MIDIRRLICNCFVFNTIFLFELTKSFNTKKGHGNGFDLPSQNVNIVVVLRKVADTVRKVSTVFFVTGKKVTSRH